MKKIIIALTLGTIIFFSLIFALIPTEETETEEFKEIEIIETVKPIEKTIAEKAKQQIENTDYLSQAIDKITKIENPEPNGIKKIADNRWEHTFKFSDDSKLIIKVMDSDQLIYKIETK